jgi:hypothetical protein
VEPRAIVRLEGLGILKKSSNLIGNSNRDLSACSIVPQPTTLPRAPIIIDMNVKFDTDVNSKYICLLTFINTETTRVRQISPGRSRN